MSAAAHYACDQSVSYEETSITVLAVALFMFRQTKETCPCTLRDLI